MTGAEAAAPNAEQAEFWAAQTGWVRQADAMDRLLRPVLDVILDRAGEVAGMRAVDIGCGTGALSMALARRGAAVTGFDISPALLAVARDRAGPDGPRLILADAQTATLPVGTDLVVSRFGAMFFADTTAAFANIRRAMAPGGRCILAAWALAKDNPYFMVPAAAAAHRLGEPPKIDRRLPGPFAFEESERVVAMLRAAGLSRAGAETITLTLPAGTPAEAAALCLEIGPATRVMAHFDATPSDRAAIGAELERRLAAWAGPDGVGIPASVHVFTAEA